MTSFHSVDRHPIIVESFESLNLEYVAVLHNDLTLEVWHTGIDNQPIISFTALPSGVDIFLTQFSTDQRRFVLDLCLRAYFRGYKYRGEEVFDEWVCRISDQVSNKN